MQMFNRPYIKSIGSRRQPRAESGRTLDLLSSLTRVTTEEEAIRSILHLFTTTFHPRGIVYVALQGDMIVSVRPHDTPPEIAQTVLRQARDARASGQTVNIPGHLILPVSTPLEVFGLVSLDLNDPYITPDSSILEDGQRLAGIAGVVISNLRAHEKMDELSILHKSALAESYPGFSSRRYFFEIAEAEFRRSKRYDRPLSAILVNVDNFKALDDAYGVKAGEHVLAELAHLFNRELRESDIRVRMGGEEFLFLLPETHLRYAQSLAERLRRRVAELPIEYNEQPINVTVSLGVVGLHSSIHSLEEFISYCDQALCQAKRNGNNQVATWALPVSEYSQTLIIRETDFRIGFY